MIKQRRNISEAEIHHIAQQIVENILNELNWQTYASAAKKRAEQKKPTDKGGNRMSKVISDLDHAASNALTSKYTKKDSDGFTSNADIWTHPSSGTQTISTHTSNQTGQKQRNRTITGPYSGNNNKEVERERGNITNHTPIDDEVDDYLTKTGQIKKRDFK